MKKLLFLTLFLITALLIISCSIENEETPQEKKEELVSIGFSTGGEIKFSNRPMKAAETDDLFAIQFYDEETGKPYAHVLGDDISQIKVDFIKDRSYKLKMTYIKNGKNIIRQDKVDEWGIPFNTHYTKTEMNHVYYSSATYFVDISSAYITAIDDSFSVGRYVELDRYHTIVESFLITPETQQIEIELKRMVFGVTLNIELFEPTTENLRFSVNFRDNHQQIYWIPLNEGKGTLTIPYLSLGFPEHFAMEEPHLDYGVVDNYHENVHISLGTQENNILFYDNKVSIARNVMAIMDFIQSAPQESSDGKITFTLQEGELEEVVVTLPSSN